MYYAHEIINLFSHLKHILALWVVCVLVSLHPPVAYASPACPIDFAVLKSSSANDHVWDEEGDHLKAFIAKMGWSFADITYDQINQGLLGMGENKKFCSIVLPGGYISARAQMISTVGRQHLRDFIRTGGGYIGFCAGAQHASCRLEIAYSAGRDNHLHQDFDYQPMTLPLLQLWDVTARAPYDWAPFLDGETLESVRLTTNAPSLKKINLSSSITRMRYHGGPTFYFTQKPAGLEVWGRAMTPSHLRGGHFRATGQPTIVKFDYEAGRVILFSQHPVFSVDAESDTINETLLLVALQTMMDGASGASCNAHLLSKIKVYQTTTNR